MRTLNDSDQGWANPARTVMKVESKRAREKVGGSTKKSMSKIKERTEQMKSKEKRSEFTGTIVDHRKLSMAWFMMLPRFLRYDGKRSSSQTFLLFNSSLDSRGSEIIRRVRTTKEDTIEHPKAIGSERRAFNDAGN